MVARREPALLCFPPRRLPLPLGSAIRSHNQTTGWGCFRSFSFPPSAALAHERGRDCPRVFCGPRQDCVQSRRADREHLDGRVRGAAIIIASNKIVREEIGSVRELMFTRWVSGPDPWLRMPRGTSPFGSWLDVIRITDLTADREFKTLPFALQLTDFFRPSILSKRCGVRQD